MVRTLTDAASVRGRRLVHLTLNYPIWVMSGIGLSSTVVAGDIAFGALVVFLVWYGACLAFWISHLRFESWEDPDDDPDGREPIEAIVLPISVRAVGSERRAA